MVDTIIPIFQRRKLRYREGCEITQGHTARRMRAPNPDFRSWRSGPSKHWDDLGGLWHQSTQAVRGGRTQGCSAARMEQIPIGHSPFSS